MKRKLNCILLIDDDEPTNFLNEMTIAEAGCAEKIVAVQSGKAALEYLVSKENGMHPQPDLIFLDINMPAMDGWEFLEHYRKLTGDQQARVVVVMLTTSHNPDDENKAKKRNDINDFRNKPLTAEIVEDVLRRHFADWV